MKRILLLSVVLLLLSGCTVEKNVAPVEPPEEASAANSEPAAPIVDNVAVTPADTGGNTDYIDTDYAKEHALSLPEGAKTYDISKIAGESRKIVYGTVILEDGRIATITISSDVKSTEEPTSYEILIIDPVEEKVLFAIPIESVYAPAIREEHGRLLAESRNKDGSVVLYSVENGELINLPFKLPKDISDIHLSPDGKKVAYYGDYRLCLVDEADDKVLIQGEEGENGFGCKPREWIDDELLVYTKVGYESFIGNGIYNIVTEKDNLLTAKHSDDSIIAVRGDKAFTIRSDYGQIFSPGYFDLSSPSYDWHSIYENPSEEWVESLSPTVSSDGKVIAIFNGGYAASSGDLELYSLEDGRLLSEMPELHAASMRFVGNSLYLYHERTATSPALCCVIPLDLK